MKRILGGCLAIAIGVAVASMTPPDSMTPQAMWALGIIAWAVTCWIFEVAPDYVVAIAMCTALALFKCVPFKTAFSSFSDNTWWLLFGALGMGCAVSKSGLLKRLSLGMMTIFPATFNGQVLALICGGTLIAPMIPSVTAKAAIIAPISMGISDAMGFIRKSTGAAGLFAAMCLGFLMTGPMFISASFVGYMMLGLLPADIRAHFNWTDWIIAAAVWNVTLLVGMYFVLRLLYTPKEAVVIAKEQEVSQRSTLGPMSRHEKITASVLLLALLFWMTEPLHGVNATLVALLGLVILLVYKVFDREVFRSGMGWDNMIFIGAIINLGNVLPALNIDQWIVRVCSPMLAPIMSNIYLVVLVLCIATYAVRFVLVSFTATTAIFTVVLIPFALNAGINPWVTGFLVYASTNIWLAFYQSTTFLTAYYAVGGEMVTHKQMFPFFAAYCIMTILGGLLSVPYWQFLGLAP